MIDPIIHSSLCGWETIRSDQWGGCPSNTLSSKKHFFIYFIIIESKFPLDDEDEENLAHFSPLLILQSVREITTETTSSHLRSCLLDISSADLFEDFHRNIYGFGEIFVCSHFSSADSFQDLTETYGIKLWDFCLLEKNFCGLLGSSRILFARDFFCGFVRGFHRKIWHQIMKFLFARNFFYRLLVRGFDRNIWHHWDLLYSTFVLRIRSRISQKYMASVRCCLFISLLPIHSRISQKNMASNYEIFVSSKLLLQIVSSRIWQKYMASMRFCLLDISSADSIEDFTEIFSISQILFAHISSAD